MKWLTPLGGIAVALAVSLVSVPWVFWAMGCVAAGEAERGDAVMKRSPIWRYLEWIDP